MKRIPRVLLQAAEREADWFFRVMKGKVPPDGDFAVRVAAAQVDAWLRTIPPFHRGVLSLRYTPRSWPRVMTGEFGRLASLVVRLECALHPAVGLSTEALERASVERLSEEIRLAEVARDRDVPGGRERPMTAVERRVARLERRACRHTKLAIRALARTRGYGPSVVPARVTQ